MPPSTPAKTKANEVELSSLMKKAISAERKALYADVQGKHLTFSAFMRKTTSDLSKSYPHRSIWVTMRGLFRVYPNVDVGSRIVIIKRAEELLASVSAAESISPNSNIAEKSAYSQSIKNITPVKTPSEPRMPVARSIIEPPTSDKSLAEDGGELDGIDVQYIKGVGPRYKALLANLNIHSVEDLLRHYPRRHLDFSDKVKISSLSAGQEVTILGVIKSANAFQSPKSMVSILTIVITDGTGSIAITRFIGGKSNKFLLDRYKNQYPKGAQVIASGIVEQDRYNRRFTLKNCEIELIGYEDEDSRGALHAPANTENTGGYNPPLQSEAAIDSLHVGRLVPIYPLTEGISLRHLRLIIHNALEKYGSYINEILPLDLRQYYGLIEEKEALTKIHFLQTMPEFVEARHRLVFDELFTLQLTLAKRRHQFDQEGKAVSLQSDKNVLVEKLLASLPFSLTGAQQRVFREIARDLASTKPMHRLVQGDVGSGKTIVALLSALIAIDNGYQVAMMAPTEILAEQHYNQCQKLIVPLGLQCALVLGKHGSRERREVREIISGGAINLIIGTHALLEDDVEFKKLGLIIIDEQHRFGVKQRARLKAKSQAPELLTMTATPIPRTLALTIHGDLDVSEIDEMPPGRKPIETKLMGPGEKKSLYEFIRQQVAAGRQIYIVFPLIEESETLSAKAATKEYEKLKEKVFPDLRLGLMHGKLKPQEKEEAMENFRTRQYDILISTTVIEVGVDVSNATVMVIENADRFGLAQLHQLRGRVGRGGDQSYCFLVSDSRSQSTRERLYVLTQTNDGFVVAEKDLSIRGPGEFLGFRQSGLPDLVLTDLTQDTKILSDARQAAIEIIKEDPQLTKYPALQKLLENQNKQMHSEILQSG